MRNDARHLTLLVSGECPCTYCKLLWIKRLLNYKKSQRWLTTFFPPKTQQLPDGVKTPEEARLTRRFLCFTVTQASTHLSVLVRHRNLLPVLPQVVRGGLPEQVGLGDLEGEHHVFLHVPVVLQQLRQTLVEKLPEGTTQLIRAAPLRGHSSSEHLHARAHVHAYTLTHTANHLLCQQCT